MELMERNTIAEMKEILDAIDKGKKVQCWNVVSDKWNDIPKNSDFRPDFHYNTYRVKPEKKWRPFKDTKELFAHNKGHDILWLKSKTSGECRLVQSYGNDYVRMQCKWNMDELMREYTFKDGRPLGVEEETNG